jgi:hypothetical protein
MRDYGEYSFLGYKTVQFGDNPTFRKNISPPTSMSKSKPINEIAIAESDTFYLFLACVIF